jgi:DNA polymerase-3 subunit delta'
VTEAQTPAPQGLPPWLQAPLQQALAQRAHARLIHGPEGVGQFELALALAHHALCEAVEAGEGGARPCGCCPGCRLYAARQHPDLRLLLPAALRAALAAAAEGDDEAADAETDEGAGEGSARSARARPSREIRVDEVRAAIAWTQTSASRGRGKLLVLHPAQALNTVAANALLKTLEEPPAGVRLLLTCADPQALLPTLRSRCQRIALPLPPRAQALAWLRARGLADAEVLLDAAGGRPDGALALHAEGFDAARWGRLPRAVAAGDAGVLAGCSVTRTVDVLQRLAHDLMCTAAGAPPRFFPAASLPAAGSRAALNDWAAALARAARHAEHPWHAPLLVEALLAQARGCFASPATAAAGRAARAYADAATLANR